MTDATPSAAAPVDATPSAAAPVVELLVVIKKQGDYPTVTTRFTCAVDHKVVLATALADARVAAALAERGVLPDACCLKWRNAEQWEFTIHDQHGLEAALAGAEANAYTSDECVALVLLPQAAPAALADRTCRTCGVLCSSRNQLFLHLQQSGHVAESAGGAEDGERKARAKTASEGSQGNAAYDSYYRRQRICGGDEAKWGAAYECLKTPLPLVVRVSRSSPLGAAVVEKMRAACTDVDGNGGGGLGALPLTDSAWSLPPSAQRSAECGPLLAAAQECGVLHRQEWASMLPVLALQAAPDDNVLDLCASPGSKTLMILDGMYEAAAESAAAGGGGGGGGDGEGEGEGEGGVSGGVVANDVSRTRAVVVARRSRRQERGCLMVTNCDGRRFPSLRRGKGYKVKFRKVLCDVPCSGDGTLRKNPANWRTWTVREGLSLHTLQRKLLQRGLECLETGGRLVYSTCSLNPIEDEAVVAAALREWPNVDTSEWVQDEAVGEPGIVDWLVPDASFSLTGTTYSTFTEPALAGKTPKQLKKALLLESMFAPQESDADYARVAAALRRTRRILPAGAGGGFFVACFTKAKLGPEVEEAKRQAAAERRAAEAAEAAANPQPEPEPESVSTLTRVCFNFQRGSCERGAGCRFSHDAAIVAAAAPPPKPGTEAAAAAAAGLATCEKLVKRPHGWEKVPREKTVYKKRFEGAVKSMRWLFRVLPEERLLGYFSYWGLQVQHTKPPVAVDSCRNPAADPRANLCEDEPGGGRRARRAALPGGAPAAERY